MENTPNKRPTLKTVAKLAAVSEATASRALSNHPRHSKKTCERIQKIATEIGYTKHPFISALMTEIRNKRQSNFTPIIALLHCLPKDWFPIPNLSNFKEGAAENAKRQGYKVEEFYLEEPGMTPERMLNVLYARGIRGVIFEHMRDEERNLEMDLSRFACVAVQYTLAASRLHKVDADPYSGVLISVEKALDYGYKNIGLVMNMHPEKLIKHRRMAAMLLAKELYKDQANFFLIDMAFGESKSNAEVAQWIRDNNIDVVLCMRRHLPAELREHGIDTPGEVAFIHLDMSHENPENFSGIDTNWIQIGEVAVNQVIDQLSRNEMGVPKQPIRTSVPCNWVDGSSLPNLTQTLQEAKP